MADLKPKYKGLFSNVKGDMFGGLTAGIVALPLALAFGLSSGLGPDAGLYGAIFLAFFAALFGGTPTQISGPTAPMTAVSMLVIAGIIQSHDGDVNAAMPLILTVFMLAGLIQIGLGLSKVGQYIKYIPYPVVSGFMTAIGVIIIATQVLPALGYYAGEDQALVQKFMPQAEEVILDKLLREQSADGLLVLDDIKQTISKGEQITETDLAAEAKTLAINSASGVLGSIKSYPRAFKNINWIEFILSISTILIIFGFKRITKAIPSTLVALLTVSITAYLLQQSGIIKYKAIPEIPSGFPMPNLEVFTGFSITAIAPFIFTAFTLAMLGTIDSLLTSVVADNITKTRHKPNQELIGQGIGNTIAGLFGGLPGAGATIRTVVNIEAGGKTKLSGMISAVLLLIILLGLGPIASKIPAAVLAGILITVGIGVMDYKGLKALPSMTWSERSILIVVMLLSTFWNLVYAVGVGLILAALVFMKKMGDQTTKEFKLTSLQDYNAENSKQWLEQEGLPINLREEVFVKRLNGPIFFGNTKDFTSLVGQLPPTATHLIIRMEDVPFIDQSGLFAFEEILLSLKRRGLAILLVSVNTQPDVRFRSIEIIPNLVQEHLVFGDMKSCIEYISKNAKDLFDKEV